MHGISRKQVYIPHINNRLYETVITGFFTIGMLNRF
jgi:hypothetical protein